MKIVKTTFLLIILLINTASFSQISTITWQQCFGTGGDYNNQEAVVKYNRGYLLSVGINET
ncbi:MAG: hypothetical protein WC055_16355, partial [Melioribacteraceae bacterium]